jgi:hypothetical protein
MTPVTQDKFGHVDGNCMAACIASILEVPLDAVPNVGTLPDWQLRINEWLRSRGLFTVLIAWDEKYVRQYMPTAWLVVAGWAERGLRHATVYRGTELVHDPHPSRAGLKIPEDVTFFAMLDPSERRRELTTTLARVDSAIAELDQEEAALG